MYNNINRYSIKSHTNAAAYLTEEAVISDSWIHFQGDLLAPPPNRAVMDRITTKAQAVHSGVPLAPSRPTAYGSPVKMDRNHITIGTSLQLENQDPQYWAKASPSEKFETITYLRECFYGEEVTTGRLPRVYRVLKR